MSLGTPAINSYKDDPLCNAVRKLVDSGVVVVAAAGNIGKNASGQKIYGAIHCPGNEPSVITVGASNTYGTDARNDDVVASFSSRGPTRSFSVDQYGLKHYDNIIGLWFKWRTLDRILHQRAASIDDGDKKD